MDWTAILKAVAALGAVAAVFGLILAFADKKFYVETDERVAKVRECLGGANCGACGFAGCDAFAQAVVDGKADPSGCAPAGAKGVAKIAAIMGVEAKADAPKVARVLCNGELGIAKHKFDYVGVRSCRVAASIAGGPKLCPYACVGLGDCELACKFGAISIVNDLARVDAHKCVACGACEKACPRSVIKLLPVESTVTVRCQNSETGRIAREMCMKACIGCKLCERQCEYDAIHVQNGFACIDPDKCTRCGKCAEKCPAGCITLE